MRVYVLPAALILLLLPGVSQADWLFTPSLGVTFGADATGNEHFTYGAAIGWMGAGVFGFEGDFSFTRNSSRATTVSIWTAGRMSSRQCSTAFSAFPWAASMAEDSVRMSPPAPECCRPRPEAGTISSTSTTLNSESISEAGRSSSSAITSVSAQT